MSGHGIFAECKEKGLEEFRKWSASLPIPHRPELCHVIETLPRPPPETVCTSSTRTTAECDYRRRSNELSLWFQSRQRDSFYPQLDRLHKKKARIPILSKSTTKRNSIPTSNMSYRT